MKTEKENLRFRLFKKKILCRILANIQDEMRGIFQETLAVEMAKGTHYSFSCHDHNATNMISQKGVLRGLRERVETEYQIYFPMRMEDSLP